MNLVFLLYYIVEYINITQVTFKKLRLKHKNIKNAFTHNIIYSKMTIFTLRHNYVIAAFSLLALHK